MRQPFDAIQSEILEKFTEALFHVDIVEQRLGKFFKDFALDRIERLSHGTHSGRDASVEPIRQPRNE